MSPTVVIRPMQPADLEQVRAVAAASPEAPQWSPGVYASYLPAAQESPLCRTAYVAEEEGRIVGFAAATLLRLSNPGGEENLCELDSMAVDPSARRRGIGSRLARALLGWAREKGGRHFSLEVRASNTAAIALYGRQGLREEGRRTRYYADPEEDALILGRAITVGSPNGKFPP